MTLAEQHEKMLLEESGIEPEVVEARDYRTVEKKVELERLGFGRAQCSVPTLLIPIYSSRGEISTYQIRPDEPRINQESKPVKYETPSGSRMTLDVHPSMREKLGDPSVPLWITEGIKKGDSLTSRGLCTVTLLGVWNWRGTNEHGGKTALPEWEYIALEERKVYVVFDSDVMVKSQVHKALSRLRGFLESRSAEVHIVYLPHGEGGKKQGVDDYFVAGHGVDDLLSHATTELREQHVGKDEDPPEVYLATPQGIVWNKPTRHSTSPTQLTNFVAEIVSDVVEDDGAEEKHLYELEVRLGDRQRCFVVPASRFASMGWVAQHLGAGAFVYPGWGYEKHAAVAIQTLSENIAERRIFAHVGWREVDGAWLYLHADGAMGATGFLPDVEVALDDGRLGGYALPEPLTGNDLATAVRISLRFLELAQLTITVPLFAGVYRAPLGEAVPVDLSLHVTGPTGAYKTELTAMAQAHYGAIFNGRYLPANWTSTENALEKQAFATKDALMVVDDFAPTGTTYDVARLHRTADRLLRAQGNRSGRGRMGPDGNLRPEYYPRGLVVSSGEDTPRGQSLRARMQVSELSPGDVDLRVLTELQRAGAEGILAAAMSGYVKWLAPRIAELKETMPVRQRELRATGVGAHARTPDVVASLALGLETFLQFATEVGAITDTRTSELWEAGWETLKTAAASQAGHQAGEEPTQRFRDLLTAAIVAGDAHVADAKTDEEPEEAARWGWRERIFGTDEYERAEWQPQGKRVGWLAGDGSLLLEPGAAFAAAQRLAREQGTSLPIAQRTLYKRLAEKGLLASRDAARSRNTTRATIAGKRKVVVHLIPDALFPDNDPNGPNDPAPDDRGSSGPKMRAVLPAPHSETAPNNGPEPTENGHKGTKGPKGPLSGEVPHDGAQQGASHGVAHPNLDGDAQLVRTEADLQALAEELQSAERVGLDLETTGLDPREDRVRILSLTISQGSWLVDCSRVDPRPLFPVLANKELIAHNALFDLGFLAEMGFELGEAGRVLDTMLISQVLEDKENA
jgi:hypothetical protein